MDATASLILWKKHLWQALAIGILFACAYLLPPLSLPVSLTLALIVCPAFIQGEVWFALGLPLAPMVAYLVTGGDILFALWIPLCPYLCLLTVSFAPRWRLSFSLEALLCVASYLIAALGMLARAGELLGGALIPQLADYATGKVQNSVMAGTILYKLTNIGFLTVPDAYRNAAGLQLGGMVVLNPLLQHELINMLRLRLNENLSVVIPSLLIQGALIVGLFTALFTQRARAHKLGKPETAPLFRTLHLPRREQGYMLAVCIGTVLTSFTDHSFVSLLCALLYAAFGAVYQLLGAAVLVFVLARRHPKRTVLYGFAATALYLLFPMALLLLGLADQFVNLRATTLNHQEEE